MTAPMPGPTGRARRCAGGASLVIFARREHKEAAWQLIEYLSRPTIQQRFYELTGDLPPRARRGRPRRSRTIAYAHAFRDQLERVRRRRRCRSGSASRTEMRLRGERVVQRRS